MTKRSAFHTIHTHDRNAMSSAAEVRGILPLGTVDALAPKPVIADTKSALRKACKSCSTPHLKGSAYCSKHAPELSA